MDIRVLDPSSAALWFAAITDVPPAADDVAKLSGLLASGPLQPHLRVIVARDGAPFGRLAARLSDNCIRIWNAAFRDQTRPNDVREAMQRMTRQVTEARRSAGFAHLPIENRPGDDLAYNELWLGVIKEEGYLETCTYRVYSSALNTVSKPAIPPVLTFRHVDSTHESVLPSLYAGVKSQTLQQRDVDRQNPRRAIDGMKMVGRGMADAVWVIAYLDDAPAGYALANLADEREFEGTSAWLVDIGCLPEHRRQGIGAALLGEVMARLRVTGVRTLLAAIDDVNSPSLQLHAALGFQPTAGRHYIFRLPPQAK